MIFKTPLEEFSANFKLNSLFNLPPKVFGCTIYVYLQKHYRAKLESRAEKCVYLGIGQD